MMTSCGFPKEHWQHIHNQRRGVALCRDAVANGHCKKIQESGKRDGRDLEDDPGR
jgi:sarcosine oxidase delta subunit